MALASAGAAHACTPEASRFQAAAAANAHSLRTSTWTFFTGRKGAPEGPGWDIYVPLIQRTLHSNCEPQTPGFAAALAGFQARARLPQTGRMDLKTAMALKGRWQSRRDSIRRAGKVCLEAKPNELKPVSAGETHLKANAKALAAWTRMRAAFNTAYPMLAHDGALEILSAWRDPQADRAKCKDNDFCNGVAKTAECSPHWSGTAFDLYVGMLDEFGPIDTNYPNRLFQSRHPIYTWMLDHAAQYGFVNYPFEPWHWEWQPRVYGY